MNRASVLFSTCLTMILVTVQAAIAQDAEVLGIRVRAAQPVRVEPPSLASPQWGTGTVTVRTIAGVTFQESESGMTYSYSALNFQRYLTSGVPWFDAALPDLPSGAQLVGLQLEGCDSNAMAHIAVALFRVDSPVGTNDVVGTLTTGDAQTPGCAFFGGSANLPAGQFVDNVNFKYHVRIEITGTDATTSVGAVRVYYKLRVSPPPGIATFSDVPVSNPFFQFVEALVASGITGGCGGGNYCPDAPVTRGQMAVFLSVALGLHFPF